MARIAVFWPHAIGYLVAGIEELVARGHSVVLFTEYESSYPSSEAIDRGAEVRSIETFGPGDRDEIDLALICGWHVPDFRNAADQLAGRCPRVLYFDNQLIGSVRQRIGRHIAPWFIHRRYDWCFVPGERQAALARDLAFAEERILRGALTHEEAVFEAVPALEVTGLVGRERFMFVGRLVAEKGIETLMAGYRTYRSSSSSPWGLTIVGDGELRDLCEGQHGVELLGHVTATATADAMARSSAFVIASHFEPYGVAIQEAAAAALPVIATSVCGAVTEVVDPGLTGLLVDPGHPDQLARAMARISNTSLDGLARMGAAGRALAAQHGPRRWADSLLSCLDVDAAPR